MTSRNLHRLGLLYAAIPLLTSVYEGYEVATTHLAQKHTIDWLGIFVPRLSLALFLAFIVYGLVRAQTHSLRGFTESRSRLSLLGAFSHLSRSS